MCGQLLDKMENLRDELRESKWSMVHGCEFMMMLSIFSSGEGTIKKIIECLNLLSLVDGARMDTFKTVARDIIYLQQKPESANGVLLIDLQKPLDKIFSKTASKWLNDVLANANDHFGISAPEIKYALVEMEDIEGKKNCSNLSFSFKNMNFQALLMSSPAHSYSIRHFRLRTLRHLGPQALPMIKTSPTAGMLLMITRTFINDYEISNENRQL